MAKSFTPVISQDSFQESLAYYKTQFIGNTIFLCKMFNILHLPVYLLFKTAQNGPKTHPEERKNILLRVLLLK